MKTPQEIEALGKNWEGDPCWDIEDSEGFEDHKQELKKYRLQKERDWACEEFNRLYQKAVSLGIEDIGKGKDERTLDLVKYLDRLEERVKALEASL